MKVRNKVMIVCVCMLCVLGLATILYVPLNNLTDGGEIMEEKNVYQGPVRPTDDEAHFRKTGETIPLGDNE